MLSTVHSMVTDDLSGIVGAGLRSGLVNRRSHLAAASSAFDGPDDKRRRETTAHNRTQPNHRVLCRFVVNSGRSYHVWNWKLVLVVLVTKFESDASVCCVGLSRRIDAGYTFIA